MAEAAQAELRDASVNEMNARQTARAAMLQAAELRRLDDGRVVRRGIGDIHTERGMGCIDCHGSWEVMGRGNKVFHREDQATVQCTDCHTATPKPLTELDARLMLGSTTT